MASSTPKTWVNSPSTTTPLSATGLNDMERRLQGPYTDPYWFGAAGTGLVDDTDAIQAAIDSLSETGGTVFFRPGQFYVSDELVLPAFVNLRGAGRESSVLRWTSDVGSGKYAIRPETVNEGTYWEIKISDLGLTGPAGNLVNGTAGCSMDGIRADRRFFIDNCIIDRFRAGVVFGRDHAYLSNSSVYQNHYNVYWPTDSSTYGDHAIFNCDLAGSTYASLVCSYANFMDNVYVSKTHLGGGPYAFARTSGAASTAWMVNCTFDATSVEYCGNGVAYGPNTNDNWVYTDVVNGGIWGVDGSAIYAIAAGHDRDAAFEFWRMEGCIIGCRLAIPDTGKSVFKMGDQINGCTFVRGEEVYVADSTSPFVTSDTGNCIDVAWGATGGRRGGVLIWTQDAVVAGDVLEVVNRDETKKGTATGVPAGVAVTSSAGSGYLGLARTGTQPVKVAGSVTAGKALVYDTGNPGKLKQAAGAAGEYVVAVALASGTDTTINADLRMGV